MVRFKIHRGEEAYGCTYVQPYSISKMLVYGDWQLKPREMGKYNSTGCQLPF